MTIGKIEELLQSFKSKIIKKPKIEFYNRRVGLGYVFSNKEETRNIKEKIIKLKKKKINNKKATIIQISSSVEEIKRI